MINSDVQNLINKFNEKYGVTLDTLAIDEACGEKNKGRRDIKCQSVFGDVLRQYVIREIQSTKHVNKNLKAFVNGFDYLFNAALNGAIPQKGSGKKLYDKLDDIYDDLDKKYVSIINSVAHHCFRYSETRDELNTMDNWGFSDPSVFFGLVKRDFVDDTNHDDLYKDAMYIKGIKMALEVKAYNDSRSFWFKLFHPIHHYRGKRLYKDVMAKLNRIAPKRKGGQEFTPKQIAENIQSDLETFRNIQDEKVFEHMGDHLYSASKAEEQLDEKDKFVDVADLFKEENSIEKEQIIVAESDQKDNPIEENVKSEEIIEKAPDLLQEKIDEPSIDK